jgi:phosphate acetyltransferase
LDLLQNFIEKARKNPARIVFPEGHDARIIAAAAKVKEMGIAVPVILGEEADVKKLASDQKVNIDGISIVSPRTESYVQKYAKMYSEARDIREAIAVKLVRKPLSFGGMMVKAGDADGMVGGVDAATATVIQTASLTTGFAEGISTPSSFFIMIVPEFNGQKDKPFLFADCAVNISPNARQLAEIGVATGHNAKRLLGIEPKIAFLSFSTKGSASHADIDKVVEAVKIAKEMAPQFAIDGELQGDAALVERVAKKKVKDSPVAGDANVLVFPDLDAGNICYKMVQYLANAKALGPILQGFSKPVNDMSRGASVDDLVGVTAITSVQAMGK